VSTDKEFAVKAADIVALYLDPPMNAIILSLDEIPSIQAIERATGYVETDSGAVVHALKSTLQPSPGKPLSPLPDGWHRNAEISPQGTSSW
jgi:hypothetical protein